MQINSSASSVTFEVAILKFLCCPLTWVASTESQLNALTTSIDKFLGLFPVSWVTEKIKNLARLRADDLNPSVFSSPVLSLLALSNGLVKKAKYSYESFSLSNNDLLRELTVVLAFFDQLLTKITNTWQINKNNKSYANFLICKHLLLLD